MYLLTTNYVYRIDLSDPLSVSRVALPGESMAHSNFTNAWLHPSGDFLIVQMNSKNHYLLHRSYSHFKPLSRFRGLRIAFVAFSISPDVNHTGDFIAATKEGTLYVASIKCHDPATQGNKRDDKYVRQVYTSRNSISGILFSDSFRVFSSFHTNGSKISWECQSITLDDLIHAFRQPPKEKQFFEPDVSYYYHSFDSFYYCLSGSSNEIYSNDQEVCGSTSKVIDWGNHPMHQAKQSLIVTEYYFLYLTSDCRSMVVLSKLMHQDPLVMPLIPTIGDELVLGVTAESNGETRWLFTQNNVYEIIISNESSSLWYALYEMGNYNKALKMIENTHETTDSRTIKNIIYIKQAYELLQEGGFGLDLSNELLIDQESRLACLKKGITLLAKSQEPFEKVALMLLSIEDQKSYFNSYSQELLREYLSLKIHQEGPVEDKVNNIILSSWIVQTFLEAIQRAESCISCEVFCNYRTKASQNKYLNRIKELDTSLFSFLKSNIQLVDSKTIYELMITMGFEDRLMKFAEMLKDHEYIAYRHLENESWPQAIQSMKKLHSQDMDISTRVIIDASSRMLLKSPQITIDFWLTLNEMDFEELLPAVLHFNEFHRTLPYAQNPTLRFLSRLIHEKNITSSRINNQYLSLLISHSISGDDENVTRDIIKTMEFLRNSSSDLRQKSVFDSDFLLRSCLRFQRIQPAISILINDFRQYETALTLALNNESCLLGEFVLKKFDDSYKNLQNPDKSKLGLIQRQTDFFHLDTSITRLENDRLKLRKTLWFVYARYLIDGVCKGIDFDIPVIIPETKLTSVSAPVTSKNTSKSSMNLKTEGKEPELQSSRLSKVLRYLFNLSKSYGDSNDLLSFKDILPLLPESVLINHFKDDIVQSLHHYNNQINHLGLEMQESSATASKLKIQVAESNLMTHKGQIYTTIEPGESCCLCRKMLIRKNIIIFQNCHHGCHKECAARFFLQSKGDYLFKKLFQNFKHSSDSVHKDALDEFLMKACPLCNESNLNALDDELIISEQKKSDLADWSISHVTFSRT
ncbi:hypothetical protein JCM33374_g567 [Metschnikowia sp. JCM 33374]|nr:hypothetical protein JCM33374_g567 [Metschnikowia sp. JCM 33374]